MASEYNCVWCDPAGFCGTAWCLLKYSDEQSDCHRLWQQLLVQCENRMQYIYMRLVVVGLAYSL
jgi:hypothetical protein